MLANLPNPSCCKTSDVRNMCERCTETYNARHQAGSLTANARITANGKKSPANMGDGELLDSHTAHVEEMKRRGIPPKMKPTAAADVGDMIDFLNDRQTVGNDDADLIQGGQGGMTGNAAEFPNASRRLLEKLGKVPVANTSANARIAAACIDHPGLSRRMMERLGKA